MNIKFRLVPSTETPTKRSSSNKNKPVRRWAARWKKLNKNEIRVQCLKKWLLGRRRCSEDSLMMHKRGANGDICIPVHESLRYPMRGI